LLDNPPLEDFTEPPQDERQISLLGQGALTGSEQEERWGNEQWSQFEQVYNAGIDAWNAALDRWYAGEFGASKQLVLRAQHFFQQAGDLYGPAGRPQVGFLDPPEDKPVDMQWHGPYRTGAGSYTTAEWRKSKMKHWGSAN
jgi:hypothetical protein